MVKRIIKAVVGTMPRRILIMIFTYLLMIVGLAVYTVQQINADYIDGQEEVLGANYKDLQKKIVPKVKDSKLLISSGDDISNQNYNALMNLQSQAQSIRNSNIGYVRIREINLAQPIYKVTNKWTLSLGATQMFETEKPGMGNFVLAGHNMNSNTRKTGILFSNLPQAKKGMLIELVTKGGVYKYRVNKISVIGPKDSVDLKDIPLKRSVFYQNPEKPLITLYCCTSNGKQRLVVQGELVK